MKRTNWLSRGWLASVFVFLYIPIVILVVYSFNSTRQGVTWNGFSTHWYAALMKDDELINGFILSLKIAIMAACASVTLGTFAAFVMDRYLRFRGRALFGVMVSAPLVMPEVIIGLSLLLLIVWLQAIVGWPERGIGTIWLAHTLVGMAYATVVIQSRLREMDKSLEEAAMDLGSKPYQVFFLVILPNIRQALVSAWLLTFTLSLDDVVLAAFLSGPGSSTMPLVIFSRARLGLDPRINAVAALTILVVSVGIIATSIYLSRAHKLRLKRIAQAAAPST